MRNSIPGKSAAGAKTLMQKGIGKADRVKGSQCSQCGFMVERPAVLTFVTGTNGLPKACKAEALPLSYTGGILPLSHTPTPHWEVLMGILPLRHVPSFSLEDPSRRFASEAGPQLLIGRF